MIPASILQVYALNFFRQMAGVIIGIYRVCVSSLNLLSSNLFPGAWNLSIKIFILFYFIYLFFSESHMSR